MIAVRMAGNDDLDAALSIAAPPGDRKREHFITRAIEGDNCFIALSDDRAVGVAVLEYTFFDNGFISLVVTRPEWRRKGIASALMAHLESVCRTGKIFSSTNESNSAMIALFQRLDYRPSGRIDNLDQGDPELIYFKELESGRRGRGE